jgi:hypothetical protein
VLKFTESWRDDEKDKERNDHVGFTSIDLPDLALPRKSGLCPFSLITHIAPPFNADAAFTPPARRHEQNAVFGRRTPVKRAARRQSVLPTPAVPGVEVINTSGSLTL